VRVVEAFLPLLAASRGSIVDVSSTMGSLTDQTDPSSPYHGVVLPAYQASKAALNSVTIGLAKALGATGVRVDAVCPGFVQTDLTPMSREQAPLTADEASLAVAAMALAGHDGPTGTFVDRDGVVAW
jgi:NAD(P)-dependent dehydrogenase (short-subunit alcohol dehydrogenase family)